VTDDYLWDKAGQPDDDIAELERLLGRFAVPPPDPAWRPSVERRPVRLTLPYLAAAAALVLACAATLGRGPGQAVSWPVVRLAGSPTVGAQAIGDAARLPVGQWLETDGASRASLAVGTIGRLDVDPGTRLRIVDAREGTHRLTLAHGRVHALIWAPPGQFVVDTPSSRAVDLGCIYTLEVRPDGSGSLEVSAGWVALEHQGRESFIPAGARSDSRPRVGPGTPYMTDAPAALVTALAALDVGSLRGDARRDALGRVLAAARPEDAVTLWHLLGEGGPGERNRVFDSLSRLVPPPAVVTREGIRAGDRAMRDAWWNALDLGDADTWREWKRRWP
jgi:hypothetical protein